MQSYIQCIHARLCLGPAYPHSITQVGLSNLALNPFPVRGVERLYVVCPLQSQLPIYFYYISDVSFFKKKIQKTGFQRQINRPVLSIFIQN